METGGGGLHRAACPSEREKMTMAALGKEWVHDQFTAAACNTERRFHGAMHVRLAQLDRLVQD